MILSKFDEMSNGCLFTPLSITKRSSHLRSELAILQNVKYVCDPVQKKHQYGWPLRFTFDDLFLSQCNAREIRAAFHEESEQPQYAATQPLFSPVCSVFVFPYHRLSGLLFYDRWIRDL